MSRINRIRYWLIHCFGDYDRYAWWAIVPVLIQTVVSNWRICGIVGHEGFDPVPGYTMCRFCEDMGWNRNSGKKVSWF